MAQNSGRENRELLVRVLSQLWHRIQVGRTGGGVIGQSAQPIVAKGGRKIVISLTVTFNR